ncbi:AMP-binding protein, partial [Kibdelosporangium lantanae]
MAAPGGHRDPRYLAKLMRAERITTIHFVPSMLQGFLTELGPDLDSYHLRRVICSGEALSPKLQQEYVESIDAPLFNLYGPTEAAVDVTSWRCVPDATLLPQSIGKLHLASTPDSDYVVMDARERSQDGDSYVYDVYLSTPDGQLVEKWEGLMLRAVRKRNGAGPWAPAMIGSYVERSLERVLGGRRAVV